MVWSHGSALARSEFLCIGATTDARYRRYIENRIECTRPESDGEGNR
jgi:hypothetical protein